jgi:copper chaperone CopZ
MKNSSTYVFLSIASIALTLLSASPSLAATASKITVNGMVCAFCAQGIEKRLYKLPSTQAVFVDLKNKVVAVEAKDGMVLDEKKLRTEITDAGYDVVKIESVADSVAVIKAQIGVKP